MPSFAKARQSIDWAGKAIDDLHGIFESFFQTARTSQFCESDFDGTGKLFKIRLESPFPPDDAERRATEALNNLRHAFDQAVFAACVAVHKTPRKDVHFPWRTNPTDLQRVFESRKNEISPEFWDTLRGQEPYPRGEGYPGGDDVIREIARIANRKHTVGIALLGHVVEISFGEVQAQGVEKLEILTPSWDPVKNEMILARFLGENIDFGDKHRLGFNPVFGDTKIARPIPVVDGLRLFLNKANGVVQSLEARAIEVIS